MLTLIASDKPLSAGHLASIESFLEKEALLITGDPSWLDTHKVVNIPLAECLNIGQMKKLRLFFDEDKIDVFCTRTKNRKKKLLLADMDSTIVTGETLDELAAKAGLKDKVSHITERAMRGELDFFEAICERVELLKGLSADAIKHTLDEIEVSKGAAPLVQTMRKNSATCILVSGGFTYFTESIAQKLSFNAHHGNTLEIENNVLTGKVVPPILDKNSKLNLLKDYTQKQQIDLSDTVAIGDGANDLPMLQTAGLGIGYHPKPLLEESLLNCIRHTDLTSVLYIQGYTKEEIVL